MRTWMVAGGMLAALVVTGCSEGNVFSLEAGTCFDDVSALTEEGGGEVGDVPIVDCAEPHDNEVYATFDLTDESFPGTEAVRQAADEGCDARFEDYVGTDSASSRFMYSHLVPTEQTWDTADDREVVCFLYDMDLEKIEGSAEGSGE